VFEDAYPVKLFAGIDLMGFLRELKLITGENIRGEWLAAVYQEISSTSRF
jgi:hypothetical protein